MTITAITATQAEAQGFTVDRHCYPWFAYKGPRFSPDETVEIITEAHVPGAGPSTDLRVRCDGLIAYWGDGVSPEATGFAEQLQEALDTTTPAASENFGGIPLLERPLTVDEAGCLSVAQGESEQIVEAAIEAIGHARSALGRLPDSIERHAVDVELDRLLTLMAYGPPDLD